MSIREVLEKSTAISCSHNRLPYIHYSKSLFANDVQLGFQCSVGRGQFIIRGNYDSFILLNVYSDAAEIKSQDGKIIFCSWKNNYTGD